MRALSLAEPEGYVRTFVDLGEPLRRLIANCRLQIENESETRHLADYMDTLLAAFPSAHLDSSAKSAISNLKSEMPEPLSERELQVLHLIEEGLSNQEIADKRCVENAFRR